MNKRLDISSWPAWRSLTRLTEPMNYQLCWLSSTIIILHSSPSLPAPFRSRKVCRSRQLTKFLTIQQLKRIYIKTWLTSFAPLTELDESLALLVELDNKMHQSPSLNASFWSRKVRISSAYNWVTIYKLLWLHSLLDRADIFSALLIS